MSQGKQIKKCRQSFNVYIPPPARKAEKLSQEVIKTEESKNQKVTKTRSGEEQIVNKKTLSSTGVETSGSQNKNSSPFKESVQQNKVEARSDCSKKVSVTLNLTKLSLVCDDDQKFKKKNCLSKVTNDSALSIVEAPKDSDSLCTCSNKLIARKNTKDINVKQETVNADLHKSIFDTSQETDGKALSLNEQPNDTLNHEEENRIFSNLWVKLCDNDNLVTKTTKAHNTYRGNDIYGDREINENCILEIYDFPAEFKTSDLREIFSTYITRGMRIRWVDDTHALGIYPSEIIAYEVLNTDLPFLKTRNLNEGIPQSRDKAKLLLPPPPPPRPKTCSASARRMVSGALGIKAVFTQAEIEEEKQLLKVAREQRVAAKQRGLKGS